MLKSGLRWTNCCDKIPDDLEEVLIRNRDHFRLAVYIMARNCFRLNDGVEIDAGKKDPQWLRLMKPGDDRDSHEIAAKKAV